MRRIRKNRKGHYWNCLAVSRGTARCMVYVTSQHRNTAFVGTCYFCFYLSASSVKLKIQLIIFTFVYCQNQLYIYIITCTNRVALLYPFLWNILYVCRQSRRDFYQNEQDIFVCGKLGSSTNLENVLHTSQNFYIS